MKNEIQLKALQPIDIVSIDAVVALGVFNLEQIKAIQLDAFKAGMTRAATICDSRATIFSNEEYVESVLDCSAVIKTMRDSLTELP